MFMMLSPLRDYMMAGLLQDPHPEHHPDLHPEQGQQVQEPCAEIKVHPESAIKRGGCNDEKMGTVAL